MREQVIKFLQNEIENNHIPGAVISITQQNKLILQEALGYRAVYPEKSPMKRQTIFDLASLTKVVATLPAILKLLEEGFIRLDDPISYFLPQFQQNGKGHITIRHLLTHTSGLPSHRPYYLTHADTKSIVKQIYNEDLEYKTGKQVIYSDLGFIILYQLIENVTQTAFEQFVDEVIFSPLEMNATGFNPSNDAHKFAATEYSKQLNDYKKGIVHDENAETMGGISGHAGLFSTINDLENFASMVENNGVFNGKTILSAATLNLSKRNFTPFASEYRGLGWILNNQIHSSCGNLFSEKSYGHTGFTGTSIWFDPDIKLHVILLTNRVHYGRKRYIIRLRPRLHNLIRSYY